MNSNQKDFVIFNQTCAGWLMQNGCKLLKVKPNKHDPSKFVYYFPSNDYVQEKVNKYLELYKK